MFVALRRVHVAASDFSRSRRFYGETLGLPEVGGFEKDWVEFGLGPVLVKLTPLRPGEVPARNQVALTLSTADIDSTLTALKERGVTVTRGPADEFTGRAAEILDPDGYRIVVFQPSDLHPDEEYVPMSEVDEKVKEKVAAWRAKEKGKAPAPAKPPARPAPKKPAPAKKPVKPAPKKPARPAPAKKPAKAGLKKPAPAKKPAKSTAKKPKK
jgi:predicted enzyme related to lactoylglutathione lyase